MSCDLDSLEVIRLSWIEDLKWDISEVLADKWYEIRERKRKEKEWLLVSVISTSGEILLNFSGQDISCFDMTETIDLNQSIRIEVVSM